MFKDDILTLNLDQLDNLFEQRVPFLFIDTLGQHKKAHHMAENEIANFIKQNNPAAHLPIVLAGISSPKVIQKLIKLTSHTHFYILETDTSDDIG